MTENDYLTVQLSDTPAASWYGTFLLLATAVSIRTKNPATMASAADFLAGARAHVGEPDASVNLGCTDLTAPVEFEIPLGELIGRIAAAVEYSPDARETMIRCLRLWA